MHFAVYGTPKTCFVTTMASTWYNLLFLLVNLILADSMILLTHLKVSFTKFHQNSYSYRWIFLNSKANSNLPRSNSCFVFIFTAGAAPCVTWLTGGAAPCVMWLTGGAAPCVMWLTGGAAPCVMWLTGGAAPCVMWLTGGAAPCVTSHTF